MSIHVNTEVIDTVLVWFSWTFVPGNFSCVANKTTECPAGTYSGVGSSECRPCPKGAFCPNNGLSSYFLCANGTYADEENLVTCKQCDAGFQCPSVGMQAPEECSNGTYSNSTGARYCILCPEGHRWVYASCAMNPLFFIPCLLHQPFVTDVVNTWIFSVTILFYCTLYNPVFFFKLRCWLYDFCI